MKRLTKVSVGSAMLITMLLFAACSKKGDVVSSPANFIPAGVTIENVTYTNYIHDVLKNNCSTCHGIAGSAPQYWYNTNTYDNAVEYGRRIMETIVEGSMQPPPRKPFSQADKDMFKAWINRGSPE